MVGRRESGERQERSTGNRGGGLKEERKTGS